MKVKGWVYKDEFEKFKETNQWCTTDKTDAPNFEHVDSTHCEHSGMVLAEWEGYLNYNLLVIIENLENIKREENIANDENIRIVFWLDS